MTSKKYAIRDIPRSIWILGFVSMLMDISSEMIHGLLPVFMVSTLGLSVVSVGLLEGFAEGINYIMRIFSGVFSDFIGKRKIIVVTGYSLAALTKPLFPLAKTFGEIFTARFVDRIGKGIRTAPRDALIADITPGHLRGSSFGLRQSLDETGAVIGPLLAALLMYLTAENIRFVFWMASIPAFLCVMLLIFGVKEPERKENGKEKTKLKLADVKKLNKNFWWVIFVAVILTMARFSDAFLVLRAQSIGLSFTSVPFIMVVMSIAYVLTAFPAGRLSDKKGRYAVLLLGTVALTIAHLVLAVASSVPVVIIGVIIWGIHLGLTQGMLASLIADKAPEELRGTGFGIMNFAIGITMFAASLTAGIIWEAESPAVTFYLGSIFAFMSVILLAITVNRQNSNVH